jgi:Beta-glucan synthesis-associated protein SKN1/KRE6/Sbg1
MGNLARSGYGATEDGVLPFSYNTCDLAALQGQGLGDGSSTLPAQRLSCVPFEIFSLSPDVLSPVHAHARPSEPAEDTLVQLVLKAIHHMVVAHHRSIFSVI